MITTYVYDYANRLIALGSQGATTTYGYDAFGSRVFQSTATTTTLYPFKWYSVASSTDTGAKHATTTEYVFNGDSLVSTVDQQTASGAATDTAQTRFIHPDQLGSTNVVTNASGTVVQTLDYYPYGAARISTNTGGADSARKYIGQFADPSNLDYLNARYYDSGRGQFMTEDPVFLALGNSSQLQQLTQQNQTRLLMDPQQMNSYNYANDNPITKKDPSGLSIWESIYLAGEIGEQAQYTFNLGKYARMTPQQRIEDAPKMNFETLASAAGLIAFNTLSGTQLMLAGFALQGLDYTPCARNMTCQTWGAASNGMTPQQISQRVLSSLGPSSSLLQQAFYSPNFGPSGGTFNNLFSGSVQARVDAAKSINTAAGSTPGGGSAPSANTLYVTPSGAVVTFGGQLVAPPPTTKK